MDNFYKQSFESRRKDTNFYMPYDSTYIKFKDEYILSVVLQVRSLGWDDPLEKEMATWSSVLAWKMP